MLPATDTTATSNTPAIEPKREVHAGWTFVGGITVATSLGSIGIETVRNFAFGAKGVPHEAEAIVTGCSWAIFAVLLAVLPFVARRIGWHWLLSAFYLFCMGMTAYCGVAYYVDGIRASARSAQQATRTFDDALRALAAAEAGRDDARTEMRKAQAAADAIHEYTPSDELQSLADRADSQARAEASDEKRGAKCGDICRKAEKERDGYLKRKTDALAKESALRLADAARTRAGDSQRRIDAARATAETGPAEASGMAGLAEDVIGINAMVYESWEGLAKPIAQVIGMLGAAALLDVGLAILLFGLGFRAAITHAPPPKPEIKTAPTKASHTTNADAAKRGRKPMTQEERIMQFAAERLRVNQGEVLGGDLGEAFAQWWQAKCPGTSVPSANVLSDVLTKRLGVAKDRRGGRTRYAAALVQ